jgi:hypothetical protein
VQWGTWQAGHFAEFHHGISVRLKLERAVHTMDQNNPPYGYIHLTVQIECCLSLDQAGWSLRPIAKEVGYGKATVEHVLKDYDYNPVQHLRNT